MSGWVSDGYGRWKKKVTGDGQVYYQNTETDETQWDMPETYDSEEDEGNEK